MLSNKKYRNKNILITGVAGTIGSALGERLLECEPASIIGLDNNESGLFSIANETGQSIETVLGDVRDKDKLLSVSKKVDIIFHVAALKHVPLCELNPMDAIKTNILAVQNIISAAQNSNVEEVIYTSTDKAVNPFNVMGTSKLMGEQLIRAANIGNTGKVFVSTRFGNVLGSSGSVVPIFQGQIKRGGPVTLTSSEMTRFVMSLGEAVNLVLEAGSLAVGGEIFVTKMHTIRIKDLAEIMIAKLAAKYGHRPDDIEIELIGTRPGEKTFEELMNSEEARRSVELENHYAILPASSDLYSVVDKVGQYRGKANVEVAYNSARDRPMSKLDLGEYLTRIEII